MLANDPRGLAADQVSAITFIAIDPIVAVPVEASVTDMRKIVEGPVIVAVLVVESPVRGQVSRLEVSEVPLATRSPSRSRPPSRLEGAYARSTGDHIGPRGGRRRPEGHGASGNDRSSRRPASVSKPVEHKIARAGSPTRRVYRDGAS